jgi:hypothetical protein
MGLYVVEPVAEAYPVRHPSPVEESLLVGAKVFIDPH